MISRVSNEGGQGSVVTQKAVQPRGVDPTVSRCRCGSRPGTSWLLYLGG